MEAQKPAIESATVKTGLSLILVTIWEPLVMLAAIVLPLLGLDVDTSAWMMYDDDGVITTSEWLLIGQSLLLPVFGALVIRFRSQATTTISGWFKTGTSGG